MSILVTCPNGHELKVKDHWAGKTGRCPRCRASMSVPAPASVSDDDVLSIIGDYEPPMSSSPPEDDDDDDASVLDEFESAMLASASGLSLIRSGVVHHKKHCRKCGKQADLWFAKCNACGTYFEEM